MKIEIAQFTFATPKVQDMKEFFSGVLKDSADLDDHEFYFTFQDKGRGGSVAVVPHNGDEKWDKPWLTLATDDLPAAIAHLKSLGVTDLENSGPTDENGDPIACVTFRDPEGRLIMLALSDDS